MSKLSWVSYQKPVPTATKNKAVDATGALGKEGGQDSQARGHESFQHLKILKTVWEAGTEEAEWTGHILHWG